MTPDVRRDDDVVHVPLPRDVFVKLPPRELLWKRRWAHVGSLVKFWEAPLDYDLPCFRSEEDFEFMTLTSSYLDSLLVDATAPAIDITVFFSPLNEMSRYRTGHSWVRDDDFEHRFSYVLLASIFWWALLWYLGV